MSSMTIGFIAAAMLLTIVAIALVAWPLLRGRDGGGNAPIAATVSAVVLPALALLVYLSVSNYDWVTPSSSAMRETMNSVEVPDVVRQLEERLENSPEDAEGWLLLGRSYLQLNMLGQAQMAFGKALELAPSNEARLSLAEADIMIDRTNLGGVAGRRVEAVLAEEPDNPKALFYGGMVAMMRNDIPTVRSRWQRLLDMSPPENIRVMLEAQLAQLGAETDGADAVTDNGIDVNVRIADELADRVSADAVLFLVARNPGIPGPPVAVVRTPVGTLPAALRISDANAMIPGRSLSALTDVQLIARVSNGGDAIAVSGDLYGEVDWKNGAPGPAGIVIDRIVE